MCNLSTCLEIFRIHQEQEKLDLEAHAVLSSFHFHSSHRHTCTLTCLMPCNGPYWKPYILDLIAIPHGQIINLAASKCLVSNVVRMGQVGIHITCIALSRISDSLSASCFMKRTLQRGLWINIDVSFFEMTHRKPCGQDAFLILYHYVGDTEYFRLNFTLLVPMNVVKTSPMTWLDTEWDTSDMLLWLYRNQFWLAVCPCLPWALHYFTSTSGRLWRDFSFP